MNKRSKIHDIIMILIIIIAALNYAGYIKVDTNLMMLLVTIALYTSSIQKSNQKTQHSQNVEPLDGSTVAFDKEAFVNLNAIVNELVKKDSVTIPGNLIVKGKTTFEDDVSLNDGKGMLFLNKAYAKFGAGARDDDGAAGVIAFNTWDDSLNIVGTGTSGRRVKIWGDTFNEGVLKASNIDSLGYLYSRGLFSSYGPSQFLSQTNPDIYSHFNWTDGKCYIRGDVVMDSHGGTGGNITCHDINGHAINTRNNLTCNGQFTCNGLSYFKMPNGAYSHLNWTDGKIYLRGDVRVDGSGGSGSVVHAGAYVHKDNSGQGLLFNQGGNRQIRLASGTDGAMLDFDNNEKMWYMSYMPDNFYRFGWDQLHWFAGGAWHWVKWSH